MALPPLLLAKGAANASSGLQKALTGDIYSRTTSEVVGKGSKAKVVEHTVHVNPVGIGLGALALGAAGFAVGAGLWAMQLKIQPTVVKTYATVIDVPEAPSYITYIPHDAVGHWVHETIKVGTQTQWIEDTWIRGVLKPGHWITTDKVQDTGKDIWVVDIPPYDEKVFHPAIPAVTHQEETGTKKSFAIEQRRGFSMQDVFDDLKDATGLGKPIFGSWAHGQFLAGGKRLW